MFPCNILKNHKILKSFQDLSKQKTNRFTTHIFFIVLDFIANYYNIDILTYI